MVSLGSVGLFAWAALCMLKIGESARCRHWTTWYNRDHPSGTGDWELQQDLFAWPCGSETGVEAVECRDSATLEDYSTYNFGAVQRHSCHANGAASDGFYCENGAAMCPNFEVRFCCDYEKYIGVPIMMTFYDAQNYCQSTFGTDLATISSEDCNMDVREEAEEDGVPSFASFYDENLLWIGLTKDDYDGDGNTDEWLDDTPIDYTNYYTFLPSDNIIPSGLVKDCYAMNKYRNDQWVPRRCSSELYFACNAPDS